MKEGCPECGGGEPMKLGLLDPQVDDENQSTTGGGRGEACVLWVRYVTPEWSRVGPKAEKGRNVTHTTEKS